jgi:predicted transcriptional regulator
VRDWLCGVNWCYHGATFNDCHPIMSTTSLKLPDDLKAQAAQAAKSKGMSTHAFMVEAIREAAIAAQKREQFVADAKAARTLMLKSGTGFDADEVHAYLRKRVAGKSPEALKAKSWQG